MSNADDSLGYAAALDAYRQAGWIGVLPMDRGAKVWPPSIKCDDARAKKPSHNKETCTVCISYTGHHGIDPSGADLTEWVQTYRNGNLVLRVPRNNAITIVGVDIDAYGSKTGAHAYAEAVRRWGPLPPTSRSTSRDEDLISGIRLFRVPPGTVLQDRINFPELGIGDIEICQFHHRYVIAWPSIHPEGRQYWWRNDAGQLVPIPVPTELPWLPQPWVEGLVKAAPSLIGDASFDVAPTLTLGTPSMRVQGRLRDAIKELNTPGTSRHDTALRHVMALMRMGKSGEPGVKHSLQMLCEVFVAITSVDHSRHPDTARGEFVRMITNDTIARELSNPGFLDWMNSIVPDYDSAPAPGGGTGAEYANNIATGDRDVNTSATAAPDQQFAAASPTADLIGIEQGFWESRQSLSMIYTTAMSRMCSPWAVLAHCAARGLALVRPCVTLPALIGGPGSLNWFAALVAESGGGKGSSGACARILVPHPITTRNLGTGEGLLDAFIKPANKETGEPRSQHESVLLTADEIDTLSALKARSGSTLMGVLRSGFSGETLGFSYRSNSSHLEAHTYRMTMVLSVQPTKADWLISDSGGGTPQRFMWFPATDSRISRNRPWPTGPLTLPDNNEWLYPRELIIPTDAEDLIVDECVKRGNGNGEALDGHALFCREKFAFALTVLDGRTAMTAEDWQLSGIAAAVSARTREQTIATIKDASRIDALDRGEVRGIELAAADESKQYEEAERVRHALRWALGKIESAEPDGITNRDLTQAANSKRTRRWLPAALQVGQSNGLIRLTETGLWVKI